MIYRLLGELRVGPVDNEQTPPGGHVRRVLAALLVNANRLVSKESLLQVSWGDVEIDETQLHKAVSGVRSLLSSIGRGGDLVTRRGVGYELRTAAEDCDMLLFLGLVQRAQQVSLGVAEADLLRDALGLWRGPLPLANVDGAAAWAEVEDLRRRRKRAVVRLGEIEVGSHRGESVVEELAALAADDPTDRRLCELLMVASFQAGEVMGALGAYDRHRTALLDATRGAPEPSVSRLRYAVASANEALIEEFEAKLREQDRVRHHTAQTPTAEPPRQLPPQLVDFIGREEWIRQTRGLLANPQPVDAAPVVVVCGPGGIGKTASAVEVARLLVKEGAYRDGQIFLNLGATAERPATPDEALAHVLQSLGVTALPGRRSEGAAIYRSLISRRRLLILADDVGDEDQVRDLIPVGAGCGMLITARRQLPGLAGARHVPALEPLTAEHSVQLFRNVVERAGLEISDDIDAVDRVVGLCAGLPLAIWIAAALRVREVQSTAELADRLADQGPAGFAYDELSVGRSIGASFDRLGLAAQQVFLGFGISRFPDFGWWTAAAVLDTDAKSDVTAALSQLVAAFLCQVSSKHRYRFHDMTGQYAYRRAVDEAVPDTSRRVYRALLTLARRAHQGLYGTDFDVVHSDEPDWAAPAAVLREVDESPIAWFDSERRNIASAVHQCARLRLTSLCWDLAVSSHEYYAVSGRFDDWFDTHTEALQACQSAGDRRGEGIMLVALGQPTLVASGREGVSGPAELRRAVELLTECDEPRALAFAVRTLANALRRRGQLTEPLRLFTQAQELYEASGDRVGSWLTQRFIGTTYLDLGEYETALSALVAAREAAVALSRPLLVAQTAYWIGQVHLGRDDLDGAEAAFTVVLDAFPEATGPGHGHGRHGLGEVARRRNDVGTADAHLDLAARLARESSDAVLEGRVYISLAEVRRAIGQTDSSTASLEHAASCFASAGSPFHQAVALSSLAEHLTSDGDIDAAELVWARVQRLYDEMDLPDADRILRPPHGASTVGEVKTVAL